MTASGRLTFAVVVSVLALMALCTVRASAILWNSAGQM